MYSPVWPSGCVSSLLAVLTLLSQFSFTIGCHYHGCHGFYSHITDAVPSLCLILGMCTALGSEMKGGKCAKLSWEMCKHKHRHEHLLVHMQITTKARLCWLGGGVAATAVQSHSTSPLSGAGQIYSSCLSWEQPSLLGSSTRRSVKGRTNDAHLVRCFCSKM